MDHGDEDDGTKNIHPAQGQSVRTILVSGRRNRILGGGIGTRERVTFLGQSIQLLLGGGIIGTRYRTPSLVRGWSQAANQIVALADRPQLAGAMRLGGIELVHNIDLTQWFTVPRKLVFA